MSAAPRAIGSARTFHPGGKDQLYARLDKLRPHRAALFQHLRGRGQDLFNVKYEVLRYDLTSPVR